MEKIIFGFFVFAFAGIGMEIIFTGFKQIVHNILLRKKIDWALLGYSPVWMILIYGSAIFLFPPVYGRIIDYNFLIRALIYGILILVVEFVSGFIIKLLVGKIPWHYKSRLAIAGFVRVDYLPFWMAAGLIIEFIYTYVILK